MRDYAKIAEEFKSSDEYQDMLNDGFSYHLLSWLEKHYPDISAKDAFYIFDHL